MNFELTQEQRMIQDMVRKFALNELEPNAQEADLKQQYPKENLKKMGELGLLGMTIPAEYQGSEMDSVSLCIVIEEVSKVCASTGSILIAHNILTSYPIFKYGDEQQKKKYLPRLASGDLLGAFALSEPEAGSDIGNIQSRATSDGEDYILNGQKSFVMNGENADLYLLFARENGKLRCFILEKDSEGISVEKISYLIGIRASGMSEIILENCIVPRSNLIQEDGEKIARDVLDFENLLIGAQAVGIAQISLESALKYSKERHQFGRPICKFQLVQEMLAEMATRVSAARGLVYQAAFERDSGRDFATKAAMAKWFASETASYSAKAAVQIYGGYGYTKDFPVERYLRDAKVMEICGETSEIQKLSITESLLT